MKRPTWQPGADGRRLVVPPPVITETREGFEYSFSIWMERNAGAAHFLQSVTYACNLPAPDLPDPGTAALTTVLVPAMRIGLPVRIESPVSPFYLENTSAYQDVFSTWIEDLKRVEIDAPAADMGRAPADDRRGAGCFFSLGVDSFYSLLRHRDEVTDLIFIEGFDIDLDRHAHRSVVHDAMAATAQAYGKRLVTVQSNVRNFLDSYLWWGYSGASVMGAIAQLLSSRLGRIYTSASHSYNLQGIAGSNPWTDPLFSTERIEFLHDGMHATRIEKIAAIADDPQAMSHLRVCWEMQGHRLNCGACDKCVRTMSMMQVLGVLDRAPGFPQQIDLEAVRKMRLHDLHLKFCSEMLQKARELGLEESPLMKAWRECAARSGDYKSARLDSTLLKMLNKTERDVLFEDLLMHAPRELEKAAAAHAHRSRDEVFDHVWKHHRDALWKAIRKGRV